MKRKLVIAMLVGVVQALQAQEPDIRAEFTEFALEPCTELMTAFAVLVQPEKTGGIRIHASDVRQAACEVDS